MGNNPEITIISPATCSGAEVLVNNLPETGTWTLSYKHMSNPIVEIQGTGPSTTLNLSPGNYSQISVSNSEGCKSTNLSLYIDYPQGLEATFTPIHVDSNNDGQMSVGDVIIHDVAIKNLLDCDITNIENASNPLINGSIPLLPAEETDDTSITTYYTLMQDDINFGNYDIFFYIGGRYGENQFASIESMYNLPLNITKGLRLIAFIDSNGDGIKNNGEQNFNAGIFTYTINGGEEHKIYAPDGEHVLYETDSSTIYDIGFTVEDIPCQGQYVLQNASYTNISVTENNITDYYFPVTISPCLDTQVYVYSTTPVPGNLYYNNILVENMGNQGSTSGTLTYTAPEGTSIVSVNSSSIPGITYTSTGFTCNYNNLGTGENIDVVVTLSLPALPQVALGDILTATATISIPTGDADPNNNSYSTQNVIVGSYDPNDKNEKHGEYIKYSEFTSDDYFTYTIRFENTGNGPANFVRIKDRLENHLEPNTIRMVASSHPYTLEQVGNHLDWRFHNIQLPPSLPDSQTGKGFVMFQVKPKPGYAVGDIISNTSSIFFDTNPAIVTNTVTTEFVENLGIKEVVSNNIIIYPNPVNDIFNFETGNKKVSSVSITDITGKIILQNKVTKENHTNVSTLSPGIYFVKIQLETGAQQTLKIIKK
jgi:uncharacterized repeat protein (TIGR01451 family)